MVRYKTPLSSIRKNDSGGSLSASHSSLQQAPNFSSAISLSDDVADVDGRKPDLAAGRAPQRGRRRTARRGAGACATPTTVADTAPATAFLPPTSAVDGRWQVAPLSACERQFTFWL